VKRAVWGVYRQLPALDAQINAVARGWEVSRLATTDRNILRLAIFEIVFMDDIPVRVTINEAVELAKEFGDDKSPAFINGLLGTVVRDGGFE
ncbi:MAG: transcription antitermination factor NusB, partial [Limnochordia bacterium]